MEWDPKQETCYDYLARKIKQAKPNLKLKIKRKHERLRPDTRRLWYGGVELAGVDYFIYGKTKCFNIRKKLLKLTIDYACEANRISLFGPRFDNITSITIYDKGLSKIIRNALEGTSWRITEKVDKKSSDIK